ncbi:MAG: TRAP transporter substrate-binding protein DctP [Gammaproteobacteria bacterium]|nr:TRAP transporter substrate-binding protein DctP [Gammaproteobacteria bacterium]
MTTSSRFVATVATTIAAIALVVAQLSLAVELKIATSAPDGTAWMKLLRQAGTDVAKATEKRVKLKFYPGGTQGDDGDVMRKMRIGQLHGGSIRTGVFGTRYSDIQLYHLPMVFRDMDEVDAVRRALDPDLIKGVGDAGYTAYGIVELGMAYAMSTREARSLADARRLKVWAPKGDIPVIRLLEAFDIKPITLTIGEVLPSLAQGVIDTVAAPPVAVLPLQWHTRLEYVLDLPFMYIYSPFVIYEQSLRGVDPADRAALHRILSAAVAEADRRSRADHNAAWNALGKQGIEFLSPKAVEVDAWRAAALDATRVWIDEGIVSHRMYAKLQSVLAEIRGAQAADNDKTLTVAER